MPLTYILVQVIFIARFLLEMVLMNICIKEGGITG
jgi:hypothetical protein